MFLFFCKPHGKQGKVVNVLLGEMYAIGGKHNFPGAKLLRCHLGVLGFLGGKEIFFHHLRNLRHLRIT
jgi:hypothetical protein